MTDLNAFDVACVVGRHCRLKAGGLHSASDLLGEMDHFAVAEALVLDSLAREHHPADGNSRILSVANTSKRLHPAWALLPPGTTGEQPGPEELLALMRKHHVGAVWLLPGQYRFSIADWCIDPLLEPLAEARVPAVVNPNEVGSSEPGADQTDWGAVAGLCRRWPTLPVIVSEFRIRRGQRQMFRALDACENLRIELSGLWLYRNIEYIVERWGAGRLLFGSNWPAFGHGMTLAHLTTAEISDADKLRIAGDNLRELIRWCEPEHPSVEFPPAADAYARFARTAERPADMRFWDCHGHIGGRMRDYHIPDGELQATVAEMQRLGVDRCCVFSFSGVTGDEVFGNDIVVEAVQRYPDRFVGFTTVNPHRGREAMLAELERGARLGLRGVKLIPHYQGYPAEGPLIDVACEWAHERHQIILNHGWGSAKQIERLLTAYPDACYIAGHATSAYAELMRRHGNLYVCSCPLLAPRACEELVAAIGADRLLFGSDLQDLPIAWGLGPILSARLTEAEKQLILGGNLRRILERYSLTDE